MKTSTLRTNLTTLILIIAGTLILFRPPIDPDLGWHLKYGEYITTHGQYLYQNFFSYTFINYKWTNSYWLSQIIMYALYSKAGVIGIGIGLSLLFATTATVLFKRVFKDTYQTPLILLFVLAGSFLLSVRPLAFSSIFLLIEIFVLSYKPRLKKYLPIMFLLWANMHADFVFGLFVLGTYTAFALVQKTQDETRKTSLSVLAFCVLVTFANPTGIHLWQTLLKETNPLQFKHIAEWKPIEFDFTKEGSLRTSVFFIFGTMFATTAIANARIKKRSQWLGYLIAGTLLLTVRSTYFFRVLTLISMFSFWEYWAPELNKSLDRVNKHAKKAISLIKPVFITMFALVIIQTFFERLSLATDIQKWSEKSKYPYGAVAYLKQTMPKGNLFNSYNWGGYLIWHLPEYKTFVDGRMPSWRDQQGSSLFEDYVAITRSPKENIQLFNNYVKETNINIVLEKSSSKFPQFLIENPSLVGTWVKAYQDEYAVVLLRQD